MTYRDVVESACAAVERRDSRRLHAPPGCFTPVLRDHLCKELELVQPNVIFASINVDQVNDESEWVGHVIRDWLRRAPSQIDETWRAQEFDEDEPERFRLTDFARLARERGYHLAVLNIDFHRAVRLMSSGFLGVLRGLEQDRHLSSINVTCADYTTLYRMRQNGGDPTFTSDYGQHHPTVDVGTVDIGDGEQVWTARGLSLDGALRGAFRVALDVGGGHPLAVEHGALLALESGHRLDLGEFRIQLVDRLAGTFGSEVVRRVEDYMPHSLVAFRDLALGERSNRVQEVVRAHPWSRVLLASEGAEPLRVASEPLRRAFLAATRPGKDGARLSVRDLYERGDFAAASTLARTTSSPDVPRWVGAACELYSELKLQLERVVYFPPTVNWRRLATVIAAAVERATEAGEPVAEQALRNLLRVVHAHEMAPPADSASIASALRAAADDQAIRTGFLVRAMVRLLCVTDDPHPVTSVYAAIPLVEESLRLYCVAVRRLAVDAGAFDGVPPDELRVWTPGNEPFEVPARGRPLSAFELLVLASATSARAGQALFASRAEVEDVGNVLVRRNLPAHYVTEPSAKLARSLTDVARAVLDAGARDGGVEFATNDVRDWLRPAPISSSK